MNEPEERPSCVSSERQIFALEKLPTLLVKGGDVDRAYSLLTDYSFIREKIQEIGVRALLEDYDSALRDSFGRAEEQDQDRRGDLHALRSVIRASSHAVADDPRQLASQLWGGIPRESSPRLRALLDNALRQSDGPWLRPLTPSLAVASEALIRTLVGHSGIIYAVAITPDGRRVVSGSADRTVRVWDLESGDVRALEAHLGHVTAVAVTPDGRRVISSSEDGTLNVWDLNGAGKPRTLPGHAPHNTNMELTPDGKIFIRPSLPSVAVTPDGRYVASAEEGGTVQIWNLERLGEHDELSIRARHSDSVTGVVVTPNGRRVISTSTDKTLKEWDIDSGKELHTYSVHVVLMPDGGSVTFPEARPGILVENVPRIKADKPRIQFYGTPFHVMIVTPDGRCVLSLVDDRTLMVWEFSPSGELRKPRVLQGHSRRINAAAVTPDGWRAISGSSDRTLKLWDLESGTELRTFEGHSTAITAVALTPEGRRIVSGGIDRIVRVWDTESEQRLHTWKGHPDTVAAVTASPNGRRAISASKDGTIKVWDLESGKHLRTLSTETPRLFGSEQTQHGEHLVRGSKPSLVVTPDSRLVIVIENVRGPSAATLASDVEFKTFDPHWYDSRPIAAVRPDGESVIYIDGFFFRLWDIESGDELRLLKGRERLTLIETADGKRVISPDECEVLKVWTLQSGYKFRAPRGDLKSVSTVSSGQLWALMPDGQRALVARKDRVEIHDLPFDTPPRMLKGHLRRVTALAVTADGKHAMAGSIDGELKLWNLQSDNALHTLKAHSAPIRALAVAPDGRYLVSASEDFTLKLWEIESGCLVTLFRDQGALFTTCISPDGRTIIGGGDTGRVHFLRLEADWH